MLTTSVAVHPQRAISTNSMGLLAVFSEDAASITIECWLPAMPTNRELSVHNALAEIIKSLQKQFHNRQERKTVTRITADCPLPARDGSARETTAAQPASTESPVPSAHRVRVKAASHRAKYSGRKDKA